jgi:hypothetical protein
MNPQLTHLVREAHHISSPPGREGGERGPGNTRDEPDYTDLGASIRAHRARGEKGQGLLRRPLRVEVVAYYFSLLSVSFTYILTQLSGYIYFSNFQLIHIPAIFNLYIIQLLSVYIYFSYFQFIYYKTLSTEPTQSPLRSKPSGIMGLACDQRRILRLR